MQGEREREKEGAQGDRFTSLSLSLSLAVSFPSLVFEASETPPCVRLHSVPWAAQAWQSALKKSVGGRGPCLRLVTNSENRGRCIPFMS